MKHISHKTTNNQIRDQVVLQSLYNNIHRSKAPQAINCSCRWIKADGAKM